jgi:hypothetical protein
MPRKLLTLRCSALPLAFRCGGSVRRGQVELNEISDAADMGSAGHEAARSLAETGRVDWDALPGLARRRGVDEGELRALMAMAQKLWNEVGESFPGAETEVEMWHEGVGVVLTGHADVLARSGREVRIGDWKFGRKDANYCEQLLGYCVLALLSDPSLEKATAGVLWVRDLEYEHYTLSREQIRTWQARLYTEVVSWDGTFRPGPHCTYCPRNHECPAANALVRRDVAALADRALVASAEAEDALERFTPDQLVELVERADTVQRYAERVRRAVKEHVERAGGEIAGSERKLAIVREQRRRADVVAAFGVLEAVGFEDPEFNVVLDLSLPKAERIVATRAGRGNGAAAVRELRAAFEQAKAIDTESVTKLVTRRT